MAAASAQGPGARGGAGPGSLPPEDLPAAGVPPASGWSRVPLKTIFVVDAVAIGTVVAGLLVIKLRHTLVLCALALFVAVVLEPPVRLLRRRGLTHGMSVTVVLLTGIGAFIALSFAFIPPVISGAERFVKSLPGLVQQAENGRGRIGAFVRSHHIENSVKKWVPKIQHDLSNVGSFGSGAVHVAHSVFSAVADLGIVVILALFILLEAPKMVNAALRLTSPERAAHLREMADEAFRSVTGYVLGKLFTSVLFGLVIFVTLTAMGVNYASILGLWVGLIDLLPLIGGLLAGIVVVPVAVFHSTAAGIVTLVIFLVYQQIENHVLGPVVMKRTMHLNPLWTLLAVLFGAALLGIIGALVAIPVAGVIQVIVKEVWKSRRQRAVTWLEGPRAPPAPAEP